MREARLILPAYQQTGEEVGEYVENQLVHKLVNAFGGYTAFNATKGEGGFIMSDGRLKKEPVVVFDIAMEDAHWPALTQIAIWLCEVANQECVYVRSPSGEVHFYNAKGPQ